MSSLTPVMLAMSCIVAAWTTAFWAGEATAQPRSGAATAEAANTFLASLTPQQKVKAVMRFDDAERFNWNERPLADRKGLPLKEMNEHQRHLALELLKAGTGTAGYEEIQKIRSREPVLREIRGPKDPNYVLSDSDLYYWSIFGTPSANDTWGLRVEGHHISVNLTFVDGQLVSSAPLFLGARPGDLTEARLQGSALRAAEPIPAAYAARALSSVEDKARELVRSLDAQQRSIAIFDRPEKRDADMISGINNRKAAPLRQAGLEARRMTAPQKALLVDLVKAYLAFMPPDLAAAQASILSGSRLDDVAFAWSGGTNRGEWHYYTVQGPTFLIDYAQARNNMTNHVHALWRDLSGDFGEGSLAKR